MSDEPMRTIRDGAEVHPGLDADHRPELVTEPEPADEPAPEAADDTPVPTVRDGVLFTPIAAEPDEDPSPAEPTPVAKPAARPRTGLLHRKKG